MSTFSCRTVLITGGGSGIGAAMAEQFHARGCQVILAGRSQQSLDAVAAKLPGVTSCVLDVADGESVRRVAAEIGDRYPELDTVISNAGIQRIVRFDGALPLETAAFDEEIDTNLKGVIFVANAFLPLLKRQQRARLIHVSSGLAFVPLVSAPIYSATKAAVHSFTVSLREQLAGGPVQVVELIPPLVATNLHRGQAAQPPGAMPLDEFTREAMRLLDGGGDELAVGRAGLLRLGARVAPGRFLKIVNQRAR